MIKVMETDYSANEMYKHVCDYILENITTRNLIEIAKECVFAGINSDNLFILAALSEKFDAWDTILKYYKSTLEDLNINEPSKKEAIEYLSIYYCKKLIDKKISPKKFLEKMKYQIYNKGVFEYDKKTLGDSIGIEDIMGLYYSIDDLRGIKLYDPDEYSNKNYEPEKLKLYNECYHEAEKYLKKKNYGMMHGKYYT